MTAIAALLTGSYGAEAAVGFLYYKVLGQQPDREDLLDYAERLQRAPSMVPVIVGELLSRSLQ